MNIFLIGYRCSGKTSVGRLLAQKSGYAYSDMDEVIVARAGQSIKEIVHAQGWPVFRQKEYKVLQELCRQKNLVIATGGGIVMDQRNIDAMKASGVRIWLKVFAETVRGRIQADQRTDDFRPSLTDHGTMDEIDTVINERNPIYDKASDFFIETDQYPPERISQMILMQLLDRSILKHLNTDSENLCLKTPL